MTQPLFLRLALGLATLACVAWLPVAASATVELINDEDVFAFKGTVTDIGVQRGNNQIGGIEYRIEGKFDYNGPLDLTKSTVTFHRFFDEEGGSGEMVLTIDNADLVCPEPAGNCKLIPDISLPTLFLGEQQQEDRGQVRDAGPVPAADARADQEQEPGSTSSTCVSTAGSRHRCWQTHPPSASRESSVSAVLRRRSRRQEQAREDGHPDQLHDLRRHELWSCSTSRRPGSAVMPGRYHLRSR